MTLLLDCGNTSMKAAIEHAGSIEITASASTEAIKKNPALCEDLLQRAGADRVQSCVAVSVVPSLTELITDSASRLGLNCSWFTSSIQNLLEVDYAAPGDDRIAACCGACVQYPGRDIIVIDAGTALTIDLLKKDRVFSGGVIVPGVATAYASLHAHTEKLPLVNLNVQAKLPGKNTEECIAGGIAALYEGGVRRIVDELSETVEEKPFCVISGGDAVFVESVLDKYKCYRHPLLVFEGLAAYIAEQDAGKK